MMAAVQIGLFADMAACAAAWVAPRLEPPRAARPRAGRDLRPAVPASIATAYAALPPLWRRLHAARDAPACHLNPSPAKSPSSATISCCRRRFAAAIAAACGDRVALRSMTLPWPDEPMEHGYASAGWTG